jgi:formamidopyrimidine-DNA glycosylase
MPELPEVEAAARVARRAVVGRTIAEVVVTHPRIARHWSAVVRRRCVGRRVLAVTRRGKSQLLHLDDGSTLVVHFRLDGDWVVETASRDTVSRGTASRGTASRSTVSRGAASRRRPPYARWALRWTDGRELVLVDPRALSTVTYYPAEAPPTFALGPEADDPTLTAAVLGARLAGRRAPIKQALLDQKVIAGLGNIYAAEALWRARIDPRRRAGTLDAREVARLRRGIREALADGVKHLGRYRTGERTVPWRVYDRAGAPCRRCPTPIATLTQGGRTTYWCPECQA